MFLNRLAKILFAPFQVYVLPDGPGPASPTVNRAPSAQTVYESSSPEAQRLFDQLQEQLNQARSSSYRPKPPKLPDPRTFDGSRTSRALTNHLYDVKQHFKVDPLKFPTDDLKIVFAASFLKDTARTWYQTLDDSPTGPPWSTFEQYEEQLQSNFSEINPLDYWLNKWDNLSQRSSVSAYLADFNAVAAHLDLTDQIKMHHFRRNLKDEVLNQLALLPEPTTFDDLVKLSNQIDGRLFAQRRSKNTPSTSSNKPRPTGSNVKAHRAPAPVNVSISTPGPVPMQLDNTQRRGPLTEAEKQRRRDNKLCLYCGEPGHIANVCPNKSKPRSGN